MAPSRRRKQLFAGFLSILICLLLIVYWLSGPAGEGSSESERYSGRAATIDSAPNAVEFDADVSEIPGSWDELVAKAVREGTSTFGTMMIEESETGPFPDPDITPVCGHDGIITYYFMDEVGIPREQAVDVQAEIDRANAMMSSLAREHAAEAGCDPTDAPDTTCYTISPYADQSGAVIAEFSERLTDLIGQEQAEKVVQSYEATARFAGFGKFEVYARFKDFQPEGEMHFHLSDLMHLRVNYAIINPASGKRCNGGLTSYEGFRGTFGDIFSIESVTPESDR
ncbi:MAG: hypothetical protein KDN22_32870 [Verrucomicrobiae bacterium]|nr:hypothetical protein [Verrucomicrobiae bacterium]